MQVTGRIRHKAEEASFCRLHTGKPPVGGREFMWKFIYKYAHNWPTDAHITVPPESGVIF